MLFCKQSWLCKRPDIYDEHNNSPQLVIIGNFQFGRWMFLPQMLI